ncbi:ABC transporter permease subunit [Planosporangium thailandense]|uniref:ABC transporter permease subunit n=1 Tax=Planosporangium thailandense TaxID=765197 RepID=UPI00197CA488
MAAPTSQPTRPRRLLASVRRRPAAVAGATILATFVILALVGPLLTPYGVHQRVGEVYAHPSAAHPLGLDDAGVDMLTLLIAGTRVSLFVGFAASVVSVIVGGSIGVLAGYAGGWVDGALMRLTDYMIVVPALPLMIVVATVWGPSVVHMVLVIGLLMWTSTARLLRAQVLSLRERASVRRARAIGCGHWRIAFRHIVPEVYGLLGATTVLTVSVAIFYEAALSFLGLGDPGTVSWGRLIEMAFERTAISSGAWWAIVPPGVCVALVVLGSSLLGNALQDAANPRAAIAHVSPRTFRVRAERGDRR